MLSEREHTTKWSELTAGWPIIAGCVLGVACGIISMPVVALSIFMTGLEHDFGWSRMEISFAYTVVTLMMLPTAPVVGAISDRNHARGMALFSLIVIGCSFLALSRIGGDISTFLALFCVMAFFGSGSSTVSFSRVVSANFVRTRGLVLGIAMSGFGLTSLVLPLILVPYIADHGWRSASVILGCAVLAMSPLIFVLLKAAHRAPNSTRQHQSITDMEGSSFTEAIKTSSFWIMAAAFALIALGIGGMGVHLVSMLKDAGIPPEQSGVIASLIGVSTIAIRLLTGFLIDRYSPTIIAAVMLVLAALCLLSFAIMGAPFAAAGAIAYGLAAGSELDIVGFLTARMFGMRAYGRIYGVLYAAIMIGAALSPISYGWVLKTTGNYMVVLQGAAVCLSLAAILLLAVPWLAKNKLPSES